MTDARNNPLNENIIRILSEGIARIASVYSSKTYTYKVNGIQKSYDIDDGKKHEFSYLLYELSQTEIGDAAIKKAKLSDEKGAELIKPLLQKGKEAVEGAIKHNHPNLAVTPIAEAIRDITDIAKHKIINPDAIKLMVIELQKRELGKAAIEQAQSRFGIPSDILLTGDAVKSGRFL